MIGSLQAKRLRTEVMRDFAGGQKAAPHVAAMMRALPLPNQSSGASFGHEEPAMPNEEFDEREQILHYAARLQGLSLLRTGDTFALVQYKITGATLDEIAAFLTADRSPAIANRGAEEHRRADLRAMLKAERALLVEFEEDKRRAGERNSDHQATEAALAEIRRRIAEIQEANQAEASGAARRPQ